MKSDELNTMLATHYTAQLLYTDGKKIGVTRLLETGVVVSVIPLITWEIMGSTRKDLSPTNLRLAAANRGAVYVAGRSPITGKMLNDQ